MTVGVASNNQPTYQPTYQRYQVPREPGTRLIEPPLKGESWLWEPPQDASERLEFLGAKFSTLRQRTQARAVSLAREHTASYSPELKGSLDSGLETDSEFKQHPIILAGHQPELFHPGVWFKDFLINQIAAAHGGLAINFIVDQDLCRESSIRVPTFQDGRMIVRNVPFDDARTAVPWELRRIGSHETWRRFPEQIAAVLKSSQPTLVHRLWKHAEAAVAKHGKIGLAIAEARHRIERDHGLRTLEVPLSALAKTVEFARFSLQLLLELPRFQEAYNRHREDYRRSHRIRNEAHPVPALEQADDWIEGPWWVYSEQSPQRNRLWAKMLDDHLHLSDRMGWQAIIEAPFVADQAVEQWRDLGREGVCLRPRALLNTMFMRLFVGDLFVHGIGGAKYDQLTDRIIADFFGLEPPTFIAATATLQLPSSVFESQVDHHVVARTAELETEIQALKDELWELRHLTKFSTQQHTPELKVLLEEKQRLLQSIPPRGEKWEWHQQMKELQQQIQQLTSQRQQQIQTEIDLKQTQLKQAKIVESREYSLALFDEQNTIAALTDLAALD